MSGAAAGSSGDLVADRRFAWARAYAADGDHAAAADLLDQTVERVPAWPPALVALGDARAALGEPEAAAAAYRAALAADPADVLGAALKLAALGATPAPAAPPEAYVRGLFDDYAGRFERALVDDLGYRTPWRIGEILDAVAPGLSFPHALDLGCGTGLMAPILRARCDRLAGVDLSRAMVAEAARKDLYDDLAVADAVAHLDASDAPLDLVVAADVFVYLGDLAPAFAAVRRRLAPGGLFAFSVEAGEGEAYAVRESLRYAHGPAYLEALGEEAGFALLHAESCTLRLDRGRPIAGLIQVLRPR